MRRPVKIASLVLVLTCALALSVIFGLFTPLTPSAPVTWHRVHAGMHRASILELVGETQWGMYPEKILETWQRDGTLGIRKLEVWYQNHGDDRATMVCEYVYWRPSKRYIFTRREP